MKNNLDGSDINVGSIEEELKVGDKVELKSKHIGTIVNINEFREPSMKYGIDIKGFNDIAFLGEEAILRKIEKQNNIDEDIEIEGFEGEKIECSEFTEKVGKDYIDYKFEYQNNLKIIKAQQLELENKNEEIKISDQLIERQYLEIDNLKSQLETQINNTHILQSQLDIANAEKIEWKKIAEKLAEEISCTDNYICKYFDAINECKYEARKDNTNTCKQCIIDWVRKEVEKGV